MKIKWLLIFILLAAVVLGACQSADTPTAAPVETEEGAQLEAPQPGIQDQTEIPYPPPQPVTQSSDVYPDPLYPDIADGEETSWEQAISMIQNGEVREITLQNEGTRVIMGLKDGRMLIAVVSNANDVQSYLATCSDQPVCQAIILIQE